MKQIKAKPITAENFKEFGSFTDLLNPEGYSLGDFYQDRLKMHSSGNMQITFSPLLVHKPEKMVVTSAEYHNYTQEGVLCLDDGSCRKRSGSGTHGSVSCTPGYHGGPEYGSMASERYSGE